MAQITDEDIMHLAQLSMLELTPEQVERFKNELTAIVDYVEQLRDVDVSGLEPTAQVTGLATVTRPDEISDYATQQELLKNVPHTDNNLIKVKRVLN